MNTALVVAVISAAVALVSVAFTGWTQLHVSKRDRRMDAKAVLDRYRGPLLDAAWQLGDRLENIRHDHFFAYLNQDSRAADAKLTTLFRFAHYLGWREFIRTQVQLLRFAGCQGHQAGRRVPQRRHVGARQRPGRRRVGNALE